MRRLFAIVSLILLALCSCKTKYIETVHYKPVEVHDTVRSTAYVRDSVTLHDSIFIHQKNDTVLVEKWHTAYKWKTSVDTQYLSREVPYVVNDTIAVIKEVPVEKVVYRQHWWQRILSGTGAVAIIGFIVALILNRKRYG